MSDWAGTRIELPDDAPAEWEDVITGLIPATLQAGDLLREFPVGLLTSA